MVDNAERSAEIRQLLSQRNSIRRQMNDLISQMNDLNETSFQSSIRARIYRLYLEKSDKLEEYYIVCRKIHFKLEDWSRISGGDDPICQRYTTYHQNTRRIRRY